MRTWRLDVDGHGFEVGERAPGTYDLTWVTGPNDGYGFTIGTNDGSPVPRESLESAARDFLRDVDPVTGYLRDD